MKMYDPNEDVRSYKDMETLQETFHSIFFHCVTARLSHIFLQLPIFFVFLVQFVEDIQL